MRTSLCTTIINVLDLISAITWSSMPKYPLPKSNLRYTLRHTWHGRALWRHNPNIKHFKTTAAWHWYMVRVCTLAIFSSLLLIQFPILAFVSHWLAHLDLSMVPDISDIYGHLHFTTISRDELNFKSSKPTRPASIGGVMFSRVIMVWDQVAKEGLTKSDAEQANLRNIASVNFILGLTGYHRHSSLQLFKDYVMLAVSLLDTNGDSQLPDNKRWRPLAMARRKQIIWPVRVNQNLIPLQQSLDFDAL